MLLVVTAAAERISTTCVNKDAYMHNDRFVIVPILKIGN